MKIRIVIGTDCLEFFNKKISIPGLLRLEVESLGLNPDDYCKDHKEEDNLLTEVVESFKSVCDGVKSLLMSLECEILF